MEIADPLIPFLGLFRRVTIGHGDPSSFFETGDKVRPAAEAPSHSAIVEHTLGLLPCLAHCPTHDESRRTLPLPSADTLLGYWRSVHHWFTGGSGATWF